MLSGPRVRDVAAVGELQHVARRERLHGPHGQRRASRLTSRRSFGKGEFWPNVDWSKTRAYAMGLGDIYVNLKGREGKGIVAPGAEYRSRARGRSGKSCVTLVDGEDRAAGRLAHLHARRGLRVVRRGRDPRPLRHEHGGLPLSAGRASLGVVTKDMFEDNAQVWSGDHCSLDPALVAGHPLRESSARRGGEDSRHRGRPCHHPPRARRRAARASWTGPRCSEDPLRRPRPRRGARYAARRGAGGSAAFVCGGPAAGIGRGLRPRSAPRRPSTSRNAGESSRIYGAGSAEAGRPASSPRGGAEADLKEKLEDGGARRPPDPDG